MTNTSQKAANKKKILLNAFDMNSVGHINHGLWTHPRDESHRFNELNYWTDLAKTLEQGLFDGLFIADITGVYDVYQNGIDLTLKESIQLPSHDPSTLISAMAAVTQNLGFGVTVNLSYETPYQFARRFASLDHLTQGRIGWNIVTGYLDSAERLIGQKGLKDHDLRYEQAEEFLELCYKFWEGSWENDAIQKDRQKRIFTDPQKVHQINHHGRFYQSQGVFQVSPSPQRTPVLFQAGASPRGLAFSTRHAECVFIGGDQPAKIKQQVDKIRELAIQQGRDPQDIKIFVGITVVTAETDQLAQQKLAEYASYASPEAGLAHYSSSVGIDLSQYADDEAIPYRQTNSIASVNNKFKENKITPNDLKAQHQLGGRYPLIVGSGETIAEKLIQLLDETGIDGFNLTRTVAPESHQDFIKWVIPQLQQRGRFKTQYENGTLRDKIFKQGDYLNQQHPASAFRCQNSKHNNSIEIDNLHPQTV
ncbi:LLM class flavin-dependent oxidoreductase [Acinetobacter bereziniae]|uniref:LLM class flavin-dependent oxidoreductase n=1 Tax=Acinetobacter bereziniae TaxID=106648 RepID=UPI001580A7DF|nr:LLM class flavin-dependent oxidoreductase [Acinetobacter bereziniae]NUF64098.1 LLM class flavin-dependent oxidoreductase [Acinetobacter bereziniae]NUG08113.1 LLM class flavin-dependent oxidoreductase [Acinetobacter bereziniae]NUG64827.1 LLM class flavin-dependent oxidoreductase [Acinetobacter bereziniae]NUG71011.1 LLM class flavin-dependent oxidoreductase [Acinetobacter bereziniae]NUG79525.1 LLM class flavin-dependent oxidoreductase [Acinetobacter bereziniae]